MRCLLNFALESENNGHNVGTAVVYLKNDSVFPFLFFVFFYIFFSFPNVQFIPQFINVIATNNDLLTVKLKVIY